MAELKIPMSLKVSPETRARLEDLAERLAGGNLTEAVERAVWLLAQPADARAASVLNLDGPEPDQYVRQALECWANVIARASADNSKDFTASEWCLIADVCNGTLWEPTVDSPATLLAANVADGHRLDGAGYRWFCDDEDERAGSVERLEMGQPTKAMRQADAAVKALVEKLAALDYAHAWAVVVAIQWFWSHAELGFDPRATPWWSLAFRRRQGRGKEE